MKLKKRTTNYLIRDLLTALKHGKIINLVGGLYGVLIGKVFFGESMFANKSNASKFAFIKWVQTLKKNGIELIDCQVYTKSPGKPWRRIYF